MLTFQKFINSDLNEAGELSTIFNKYEKKFSELKVTSPKGPVEGVEVTIDKLGNESLVKLVSNKGRGGILSLSFKNAQQLRDIGAIISDALNELAKQYDKLDKDKTEEIRKSL